MVNVVRSASSRGEGTDRSIVSPSCQAIRAAVSSLYRLTDFHHEYIESGGFANVYKVTHLETGGVMALKLNKCCTIQTYKLSELELLKKLTHPNILQLYGACVARGRLHPLTEYFEDGTLAQLMNCKSSCLTFCSKTGIALDIARGMKYMHNADVCHRDLTVNNVLIRRLPRGMFKAVVADLGMALWTPANRKTRCPDWMSSICPAPWCLYQAEDVYSFGVILFSLVAGFGKNPCTKGDISGYYNVFARSFPANTPDMFIRLVFYCWSKYVHDRPTFQKCVECLTVLLFDACRMVRSDGGAATNPVDPEDQRRNSVAVPESATTCYQMLQEYFDANQEDETKTNSLGAMSLSAMMDIHDNGEEEPQCLPVNPRKETGQKDEQTITANEHVENVCNLMEKMDLE
uniref:dual-specificity kinase n=1 Tax=Anopheles epiroticus TaxID=199890 RepID=A0A182PTZ2_9DIPT